MKIVIVVFIILCLITFAIGAVISAIAGPEDF